MSGRRTTREQRIDEFARLALELAALDPEALSVLFADLAEAIGKNERKRRPKR